MEDYLENYFDLLLDQLKTELSELPESSNLIVSSGGASSPGSSTTSTNNTSTVGATPFSTTTPTATKAAPVVDSNCDHHENERIVLNNQVNANGVNYVPSYNNVSSDSNVSSTAAANIGSPPTATFHSRESPLSYGGYSRSSFYENNDEMSFNLLTASQIQRIIDQYKPLVCVGQNGTPMETKSDKKDKKINGTSYTNNLIYINLFGSNVNDIEKSYGGLILPPFIENALLYLVRYGINSVGIFRKSGVKSRITALRQKLEAMTGSKVNNSSSPSTLSATKSSNSPYNGTGSLRNRFDGSAAGPNLVNLGMESKTSTLKYKLSTYVPGEEFCVYDVADMVKMWLREITPRPLITKEVISAYKEMILVNNNSFDSSNGPHELGLKLAVLLSDSQRSILEIFLYFLSLFASNSEINQMSSQNLAICFTPSLCECNTFSGITTNTFSGLNPPPPPANPISNNVINFHLNNNNGLPVTLETNNGFQVNGPLTRSVETEIIFDAQKCLQYLIDNCSSIFMVPSNSFTLSNCITTTLPGNVKTSPPMRLESGDDISMDYSTSTNPVQEPESMDIASSVYTETTSPPKSDLNNTSNQSYDSVDHLNTLMPSLSLSNNFNSHHCTVNNLPTLLNHSSSTSSLINGGNLLPSAYESTTIINAAPIDILKRILYQRNLFDPTCVEWRIIKQSLADNCDLFEFKVQSSFFLPLKTFTVERKWSFIESQSFIQPSSSSSSTPTTKTTSSTLPSPSSSKSFYASLKRSKPNKASFKGIVLRETGYLYDSWWKIGTLGEGKCQLDISIALDLRGHSYYWYTNTFPAIIDWQLYQIKQSFLVDCIETKNFKSTNV